MTRNLIKKLLLPAVLLLLCIGQTARAQDLAIKADYFLLVNLSGGVATDPTGMVTLEPGVLSHTIEFTASAKVRMKDVAIDFSADQVRWNMRRSLPVRYNDPQAPEQGMCLEKVSAEEVAFFQRNKTLYVRLTFFDQNGVYVGELVQKGVKIQDIQSGKVYKLEKGILAWQAKNKM